MPEPLGLAQPGITGAATVLGPTGFSDFMGQMGKAMYTKQKTTEAKREKQFEGLLDVATDVWVQDQKAFDEKFGEYKTNATNMFRAAAEEGRELSLSELMDLRGQKNSLVNYRTQSLGQKKIYDNAVSTLMKDPDKYDINASLGNLNVAFRDKDLSERQMGNFIVMKNKMPMKYMDYVKGIGIKGSKITGKEGGYYTNIDEKEAIRRATSYFNTPVGMEMYQYMAENGYVSSPEEFIQKTVKDAIGMIPRDYKAIPKKDETKTGSVPKGYTPIENAYVVPEVSSYTKNGKRYSYKPKNQINLGGYFDKNNTVRIAGNNVIPDKLAYFYVDDETGKRLTQDERKAGKQGTLKPYVWGIYTSPAADKYSEPVEEDNWFEVTKATVSEIKRRAKLWEPGQQSTSDNNQNNVYSDILNQ